MITPLLRGGGTKAPVLHEVHHLGDPAPQHVQARLLAHTRRLDLVVEVRGYGQGRLSVVLC